MKRAALAAFAALAAAAPSAIAVEKVDLVRAAMVEKIASFIVWPGAPAPRSALCVSPEHPQLAALKTYYDAAGGSEKAVTLQVLKAQDAATGCRIAFLAPREVAELKRWRALAEKDHVLLVAEGTEAAKAGVHVGFYFHMNRPRLEVNRKALEASGLKASFKLLEMATLVE